MSVPVQTRAEDAAPGAPAPPPPEWRGRAPRIGAGGVLLALLVIYLAAFLGRPHGYSFLPDGLLDNLVMAVGAVICLVRGAVVAVRRVPMMLLGVASVVFTAGNLVHVFHDRLLTPVPYPSWADACYLAGYPLLVAAVVTMAYPELKGISVGSLLDGLLGGLSIAAAMSVLTVAPVLRTLSGSPLTRAVGAAYPVSDMIIVALIVGVFTLKGGRPSPTWICMSAGMLAEAVSDTVYLHQVAHGTYVIGTLLDSGWAIGIAGFGYAALCTDRPTPGRERTSQVLLVPNAFSVAAIGALIYGSLTDHNLPIYSVVFITGGLLTAVKRTAVGFSALKLLSASQRQAQTDELTQLHNRRHFDQEVQRILLERPPERQVAVVMVDLDGFKGINDTFGHHAGDELLRQIASRLRRSLRGGDLLARLGGDEFGLLLADCDRETALVIGERLVLEICHPMLIEGEVHTIGASVGLALCPDDGTDMATLLQRADAAMFDAKANRQGAISYDPQRHHEDRDRLNVREGLAGHELVLHYQPQFALRDGRMTGAEALVRWQHPTRGLLYPDAFLSFFEQAGMMAELTLEVLAVAARDREAWRRQGLELEISVNLAPSALLRADLIESIAKVLAQHRMPAHALTIEITENAMMIDVERARQTLRELRALGVQLALDDYGTGYCSLTYLRDLPLQEIKIDRSFVMTLEPGTIDAAIVTSSVQLAKTLGLRTVAEGVETAATLNLLRELGCDVAQGYYLGRPVPAGKLLSTPRPALAGV